jgi:serine/threonine protein kinase
MTYSLFILSYAMKKLKKKIDQDYFINTSDYREASILFEHNYEYLIKYVDCFFDNDGYFYLITEFCEVIYLFSLV